MAYNFVPVERDQQPLLPPNIKEWLPDDHVAWFILDVIDDLDLSPFHEGRREDGWGRAAYDPHMRDRGPALRLLHRDARRGRSSGG